VDQHGGDGGVIKADIFVNKLECCVGGGGGGGGGGSSSRGEGGGGGGSGIGRRMDVLGLLLLRFRMFF
jgi:hypothetical protein